MANSLGRKKQILLLIELEFRDQFKIAKSCKEYTNLVAQLPEIYVGKLDFLNAIVRILCNAAKKSMKEKKIFMGPWRKKSFMEMKWSSSLERKPFDDDSLNNKSTNLQLHPSSRQQSHHSSSCLQFSAAPPAVVVT
ncbi:hypothetical protein Dsin_001782 [Dipteronia sinensis]|uniref:Uncharacterized protein n=1 Tax=Dipteronia sinensis TaxID=43782 RepID=A0AAE0B4J1_9ROSI|nr:hypothetical protein Dsin_001782 [Dipteronia sinensis]